MADWTAPEHCSGSYCWGWYSNGNVPEDGVMGGMDVDGGPLYVGRLTYEDNIIPCRVCPDHGCALVGYNGIEIRAEKYQVLRSTNVDWVAGQGGDVPQEAIAAGMTADGEPLYVGRVEYNGGLFIGKIQPSIGVLLITFNGKEEPFPNYEVLILT